MKVISPTTPKPPDPKAILLIGPPGNGKNVLAMGFPDLGIFDCNRNLDGPERYIRETLKNTALAYRLDSIIWDDKDNQPRPIEKCFDHLMDEITMEAKEPKSKCYLLDSLSDINEFIIRKILKDQNKSEMESRHWQPFKSHFLHLLISKLRSLNAHVICTVHEEEKTENDSKEVMKKNVVGYEPTVQGKLGDMLGGFFTDVWRCWSKPGVPVEKTDFMLSTQPTSKSRYLKNSFGMPNEITLTGKGFSAIEQYVKGKL